MTDRIERIVLPSSSSSSPFSTEHTAVGADGDDDASREWRSRNSHGHDGFVAVVVGEKRGMDDCGNVRAQPQPAEIRKPILDAARKPGVASSSRRGLRRRGNRTGSVCDGVNLSGLSSSQTDDCLPFD